jgi:hypothetical protein
LKEKEDKDFNNVKLLLCMKDMNGMWKSYKNKKNVETKNNKLKIDYVKRN